MPFNKNKTLRMYWSKSERDHMICYPSKAHGWSLYGLLESKGFKDFKNNLIKQGYDITTLKISCDLIKEMPLER